MKQKVQWIYGTHAVIAALRNPERVAHRICLLKTTPHHPEFQNIPVSVEEPIFFQKKFGPQAVHQGIALETTPLPPLTLEEMLESLSNASSALVCLLDHVSDPHNIGAILRSAAALGAAAVVISHHHMPDVSNAVITKTASGAAEIVPIIPVVNLNQAIQTLKKHEFWIIGLTETGEKSLDEQDLQGRYAMILGSEGQGIRPLIQKNCDFHCTLPTTEVFPVLNVSTAAAIAFYEFHRQNKTHLRVD